MPARQAMTRYRDRVLMVKSTTTSYYDLFLNRMSEARDLVAQVLTRGRREPHLDLINADRGQPLERRRHLLRRPRHGEGADGERSIASRGVEPQLLDPRDRGLHPAFGQALRQPPVTLLRRPPDGGAARTPDPDRDPARLHRPRPLAEVATPPLVAQRDPDVVDGRVEQLAAIGERHAEHVELLLDVSGADTEDRPAVRQRVERGERLRRLQRMAIGG